MNRQIRPLAAFGITMASCLPLSASAQAYPVDCAILLCLAGGWPASAPCAQARAVFIQRITPWPIEPPLQIWNCPMRAAVSAPPEGAEGTGIHHISFQFDAIPESRANAIGNLQVQGTRGADIDIIGDVFDVIRSIRVFHIEFTQRQGRDGDCVRSDRTRLGAYGMQGDFDWTEVDRDRIPAASAFVRQGGCDPMEYRSVFVEWRDHYGQYGSEEVHY